MDKAPLGSHIRMSDPPLPIRLPANLHFGKQEMMLSAVGSVSPIAEAQIEAQVSGLVLV